MLTGFWGAKRQKITMMFLIELLEEQIFYNTISLSCSWENIYRLFPIVIQQFSRRNSSKDLSKGHSIRSFFFAQCEYSPENFWQILKEILVEIDFNQEIRATWGNTEVPQTLFYYSLL